MRSTDDSARGLLAPAGRAIPEPRQIDLSDTALLDLLPHPAFVVAVEGDDAFRFVYVNDAYLEFLGGADEATGDLRSVLPAHALVSHVPRVRAIRTRAAPGQLRSRLGWHESARRVLTVEVNPVVDPDGQCRHLLGAAREVTQQRHTEAQLVHRTRHDPFTELRIA